MSRVPTTSAATPNRTIVTAGRRSPGQAVGAGSAIEIGGVNIPVIGGPAVVEGRGALLELARAIRDAGASMIRAGTSRPLASAQTGHGDALDTLEYLAEARDLTGMPIAMAVLDPGDVAHASRVVDLLIIGEAGIRNQPLLAEVGRAGHPVVIERALGATLDDLLDAAEAVMQHGNPHVVLCERGMCTFDSRVPAILDISAIPRLKSLTHLPVIIAPGEACVRSGLVEPLSCAAIAVGADGLMLEVHSGDSQPPTGAPDRGGSLGVAAFARLVEQLRPFATAAGRTMRVGNDSLSQTGTNAVPLAPTQRPLDALAALRSDIEQVDRRIIELIGQRVGLARDAGKVKREAGLPVIDEDQEHEVLARVRALAESAGLPYEELRALQAYLIEISRRAQTHPNPSSRD